MAAASLVASSSGVRVGLGAPPEARREPRTEGGGRAVFVVVVLVVVIVGGGVVVVAVGSEAIFGGGGGGSEVEVVGVGLAGGVLVEEVEMVGRAVWDGDCCCLGGRRVDWFGGRWAILGPRGGWL